MRKKRALLGTMKACATAYLGADHLALYTSSNLPKKVQQLILVKNFSKHLKFKDLEKFKCVSHKICVSSLHCVGSVMPYVHDNDCSQYMLPCLIIEKGLLGNYFLLTFREGSNLQACDCF